MSAPVFVSYSSMDGPHVRALVASLEARGIACWFSGRDVAPGEYFGDAIVEAIERAPAMVLVFSNNANGSEEIKKEIVLANQRRMTIIPVRLEDATPSRAFRYELATRNWIDFFPNWDDGVAALSKRIIAILNATVIDLPPAAASQPATSPQLTPPPQPAPPPEAAAPPERFAKPAPPPLQPPSQRRASSRNLAYLLGGTGVLFFGAAAWVALRTQTPALFPPAMTPSPAISASRTPSPIITFSPTPVVPVETPTFIPPATPGAATPTALTIATVNNGDMIRMQKLTDDFTKSNPDIKLNWVTLGENVLRQKVTTDIATKGGQFDILTIGAYEVPIWGKKGWLVPLEKLGADYDVDDLLPAIRSSLTVDGKLYAAPFYGESSFVMYRKDLMSKAGLEMPDAPDWKFIRDAADKMTDKVAGIYGICLRGKAGWGENMALLTAMANSFGARWFDAVWNPQFNSREWKATLDYYLALMKADGPPGAASNGFNENLALFNSGKCGIWIDSTGAGSFVTGRDSTVADKVGFALAPDNGSGKRGNWLWAWALAVPASSAKLDAAEKFIGWATSKHYTELVASMSGWADAPQGTRQSLYENPNYQKVAPFARMTLESINSADPTHPTDKPVPYVGVQFVAIPEFQGIATAVGQDFAAALAGTMTEASALAAAQANTETAMRRAGYIR